MLAEVHGLPWALALGPISIQEFFSERLLCACPVHTLQRQQWAELPGARPGTDLMQLMVQLMSVIIRHVESLDVKRLPQNRAWVRPPSSLPSWLWS